MESSGDKLRALLLALALHLLCALALFGGLWWTQETRPVVMPGPVIEAVLVGPTAAPAPSGTRAPAPRPPQPKPEPPKPETPKPEPPKPEPTPAEAAPPPPPPDRQDVIERERIAALAQEKAEQEKKEQAERVRREQILLEEQEREQQRQLEEIRKKREAAEKKLRDEQARMKKLEADRKAMQQAAEAERAKAAQAAAEAEQRAAQAQTGAGGQDNDLAARYAAAIQAAVTSSWNRPDSAQAGLRCAVQIKQIPGGDVISVQVVSPCNADAPTRNSIEQAVMRAAPLPYQGYENVFQRQITFNFKYDG
ncbi:MAG TPA: cell envelope integrity protein TolA [Dokdonella sp.]|uniref:cell envelope integrity protein TolA n=1 Tax=Dokdonella sp. TaxID=2291710 RepID=UPI002C5CB83A|nr:cell envelope integrity protein TolA [Dokdonella sp.]HUD43529.1 cell envelope integrity protein TolA [Dokdonella sp.]